MPEESAVLHPRPQFAREPWTDLCGQWGFAYDDADVGLPEGWFRDPAKFDRTITVPFPPESPASGIGDPAFHPVVWYRRAFTVDQPAQLRPARRTRFRRQQMTEPDTTPDRQILNLGAVDYRAQVWVNGQLVAVHEGGMTPFSADITGALRHDAQEQVLVVRAEDDPFDLAQPRGKQYWLPASEGIWHPRTTGIWQPVWLEPVATTHLTRLTWTSDVSNGTLGLRVELNQRPATPLQLHLRLRLGDETLAEDRYTVSEREIRREIALNVSNTATTVNRRRFLWAPEHPNLIDAELTLYDGERALDRISSYAGFRSVGSAGGRFTLNGRPYYLRMVLEQGFWPESHLAAPDAEALRREVELIKELGFNGARIHQKVEDPRFLYWCDRLGLLVWGEMANAFAFSPLAAERLTREWSAIVRRDASHPCIVAWMPLNESWGVPALGDDEAQRNFVRALYHLTHTLDGTRPVLGNDGWETLANDIWGFHDYTIDGAMLRARFGTPEALARYITGTVPTPHGHQAVLPGIEHRGQPIMITEFGGISYAPKPGETWYAYGTVPDAAAYLAGYAELVGALLDCPQLSGFCYTQLTDTVQETNGLLTADRQHKLDPAAVRASTSARAQPIALGEIATQRSLDASGTAATLPAVSDV